MALGFLFGRRKEHKPIPTIDNLDETEESCQLSDAFDAVENVNPVNEVYFMNTEFASSFRSPSASPVPEMLHRRQKTRTFSDRVREYKKQPSTDVSEFDVEVALGRSAFAFQMIPNGNFSFCSRDDSEVATRTYVRENSDFGRRSSAKSPYVNAMYLMDMGSVDDSEIGSATAEKIRLRHMGSALSYRLELSGTPDFSAYEDDDDMSYRPRHYRNHSDTSDNVTSLSSFRERNKMIRLESIVGNMQRKEGSVLEFGVIDADRLMEMSTPRLFKSNSEELLPSDKMPKGGALLSRDMIPHSLLMENTRLESFPINVLSDIIEEDEDEYESDGSKKGREKQDEDAQSRSSSESDVTEPKIMLRRSNFTVRVRPTDITEKDGFMNPAFDLDSESVQECEDKSEKKTFLRVESIKHRKLKSNTSKKENVVAEEPKRRRNKRDESLHTMLLERYLAETVVHKYMME